VLHTPCVASFEKSKPSAILKFAGFCVPLIGISIDNCGCKEFLKLAMKLSALWNNLLDDAATSQGRNSTL